MRHFDLFRPLHLYVQSRALLMLGRMLPLHVCAATAVLHVCSDVQIGVGGVIMFDPCDSRAVSLAAAVSCRR